MTRHLGRRYYKCRVWDGGLGSDGRLRRKAGVQEAYKRIDGPIKGSLTGDPDGQDGGDYKEE